MALAVKSKSPKTHLSVHEPKIVRPEIDMQEAMNAMRFRPIVPKMRSVAKSIKVPAVPLPWVIDRCLSSTYTLKSKAHCSPEPRSQNFMAGRIHSFSGVNRFIWVNDLVRPVPANHPAQAIGETALDVLPTDA